jgi:hypothetical protein
MTKHTCAIPKQSKTTKFRVPIKVPEPWKIQSISQYRRAHLLKQNAKEVSAATANESYKTRSATDAAVPSSSAIAPPSMVRSSSYDARARSMSMDERVELIEKKRNSITTDQIRRELDILHKNSNIIRTKIHSLSVVRYSLLWLLKKASLCERAELC